MKFKLNPKTVKEVIIGKLFQLTVLTLTFTYLFNTVADKLLTYFLNKRIESIYTHNFSLGSQGLILIIPSAFISIWIIKKLIRVGERLSYTSFAVKLSKFGYKLSPLADKMGLSKFLYIDKTDSGRWYSSFLLPLRIAKLLVKVSIFAILSLISLVGAIVLFFVNSFSPSSSGGSNPSYSGSISNSNNKQKLKSEAEWEAKQKQKEADHAWKYAGKQARHNINTRYFDERVNRANSMQQEADAAAKKARNV